MLDRGSWGTPHPRPFYSQARDPLPIVQEAEWAPWSVWTGAKNVASTGIRSRTFQSAANRYNDCDIPAEIYLHENLNHILISVTYETFWGMLLWEFPYKFYVFQFEAGFCNTLSCLFVLK